MKNITSSKVALVFSYVLALGLAGTVAFAESNSGSLVGGLEANVGVNTSVQGSQNNSNNTNSDDRSNVSVTSSSNVSGELENDSDDRSEARGSSSSMILFRSDIKDDSQAEHNWNRSTWMNESSSVSTDDQFKAYVTSAMSADQYLNKVDSNDDHVSVSYKERARLFGFIPVSVRATGTVNADGTVKVRYPWYRFLMSTNKNEIESKLNADIQAMGWKNGNSSFNASTRAKLVSSIYSAMHRDDATTK